VSSTSHDLDPPATVDTPQRGAPVTLVPVRGAGTVHGEVTLWTASAGGAVVTSRVRAGLGAASALYGERVWVSARTSQTSALVVFHAIGQPVDARRDELELTGVTLLASETRRGTLRAQVARPVLLLRDGAPSRGTSTVDLSSSGCRVRLPEGQDYQEGERLQAAVEVDAGPAVWARGEVVRVDRDLAEVALRFLEVDDADRDRLDRDVLTWFSEQSPR
jgi:hypothetical protein